MKTITLIALVFLPRIVFAQDCQCRSSAYATAEEVAALKAEVAKLKEQMQLVIDANPGLRENINAELKIRAALEDKKRKEANAEALKGRTIREIEKAGKTITMENGTLLRVHENYFSVAIDAK